MVKKKEKEKLKTILTCESCGTEITPDQPVWVSDKYVFCSEECIASWYGNEQELDETSYEELLEDYGKEVEANGD